MEMNPVAIVMIIIIGIMFAVALCALAVAVWRLIIPFFTSSRSPLVLFRNSLNLDRLRWNIHHRNDDDDDDDSDDDDLDESTLRVLSTLDSATIVVDDDDEVVRASSSVYDLGLIHNDVIISPEVLSAIDEVRSSGHRKIFDLVTMTAVEPIKDALGPGRNLDGVPDKSRSMRSHEIVEEDYPDDSVVNAAGILTRPNWLKITVRSISDHFILVLVNDMSESRRFEQVRNAFVTNVSEQLKQPVQALEELSKDLERENSTPEEIHRDAALVRKQSKYLNHMVDDLLLLIEAQEKVVPNESNRIRVSFAVKSAIQACHARAVQNSVTIIEKIDNSVWVNADASQIKAAVIKLLENAIDYSPAKSSVIVSVSKSEDSKHALIRVIDKGKGIAKSEQTRIFERFYRGSNQDEKSQDGVGLGLAIVKHVALTHRGSVTVWSSLGNGSTFTLFLPLATNSAA